MDIEERIYSQFQNLYDELTNLDPGDRERYLLERYSGDPDLMKGLLALFESVDHENGDALAAGRGDFLNARDFFADNLEEPFSKDDGRVLDRHLGDSRLRNGDSVGSTSSVSSNHLGFNEKYNLGKEIGRGGMGVVLEGQDLDLRRTVAIKFMKDNPELQPELAARFREEAQLQGQLEHPNICPVHELGFDEHGKPYFTMKKVQGHSLRQIIDFMREDVAFFKNTYTLSALLNIFNKVCDAVSFAHSHGVIHRDLKPGNIMVGDFGEVWLMDWGLAKVVDTPDPTADSISNHVVSDRSTNGSHETVAGKIMGTLFYMPPEQALGDIHRVGFKSDIYSLGAILYEMIAIQAPFEDSSVLLLLQDVIQNELTPPGKLKNAPPISDELEAVVMKAMAGDPEDRYPSVEALKQDVQHFLDGGLLSAMRYSPLEKAKKWIARHRQAALGLAFTLVITLAGMFSIWQMNLYEVRQEEKTYLATQKIHIDSISSYLKDAKKLIDERSFEEGIAQINQFEGNFGSIIDQLMHLEKLAELEPAWLAQITSFREEARVMKGEALNYWISSEMERHKSSPSNLDELEHFYTQIQKEAAGYQLPMAEMALFLCRQYVTTGNWEKVALWTASAFTNQPTARASAECFLLNAEHSLEQNQFNQAAKQYYMALQIIEDRFPALKAKASMGLVKSLANLGPNADSPFQEGVTARTTALQYLMTLIKPDGQLHAEIEEACSSEEAVLLREQTQTWLFILKHVTKRIHVEGLDPEGLQFGFQLDTTGDGQKDAIQVTHPSLSPLSVHLVSLNMHKEEGTAVLTEFFTRDLTSLIDQEYPQFREQKIVVCGLFTAKVLKNSKKPQFFFQVQFATGMATLGLEKLNSEKIIFKMFVPQRAPGKGRHIAVSDLDRDGLKDMVITFNNQHRQAYLIFQEKGGRFSNPIAFDKGPLSKRSDYPAVYIRDLDGDGSDEIILLHGAWSIFGVEIWKVIQERTLKKVCSFPVGEPQEIVFIEEENRTLLALAQRLGMPGMKRALVKKRINLGKQGIQVLKYEDETLSLDKSYPSDLPGGYRTSFHSALFGMMDHSNILVEAIAWADYKKLTNSEFTRFVPITGNMKGDILHHESCTASLNTRGRALTFTSDWKRPGMSSTYCYLKMNEGDLYGVAEKKLPTFSPRQTGEAYQRASFLLEFGLPEQAAQYAAQEIQHLNDTDHQFTKLWRVRLGGLAESGKPTTIIDECSQLYPYPELVGDILTIGDWMASEFQLFDSVLAIYRKWSLEPTLLPLIRENLKHKVDSLDHKTQLLQQEKLDLVDVFLGKRPGMEIISTSPELLSKNQLVINLQSQKNTLLVPSSSGLHIFSPFSGVLVHLGNRPIQFEAELEAKHITWWSGFNFGLFSLSALQTNNHTNDAVYSGLGSGGGSYLNEFALAMNQNTDQGILPKIDHLIGKRLIIKGLLDDDGTFRLTLREKSTGVLIYTHKTPNVHITPGQVTLFGVRSYIDGNNMEGTLHHLKLFGGVEVLDGSDPRVTAFFKQFPIIESLSEISMAKAGNEDVQPLWNQLIERSQAELPKLDQDERANFQAQLDHFQLNAVSLDHHKLAQVMLNLKTHHRANHISSWLQNIPSYSSSPELWQTVGSSIHTVYFPSIGCYDLVNVVQDKALPQYALPFITKKMSLHHPENNAIALQYAKALFHESDLTFDGEFLDFTENITFSSADRDWVNERRAFVYARSMQWEKALELLQSGCPEHEYKLKEMVEEVYRLRTDHLEYLKEKYARMGYE